MGEFIMNAHEQAIEILKKRRDELAEDQILGAIVESNLTHCRHALVSMLLKSCGFETIISHLPYIPKDCFNGNIIPNKIILPNGIFKIEGSAFTATDIEEIYIPKSVGSLGSFVFSDCYSLKKIDIPESFFGFRDLILAGCPNDDVEITYY
jgi:hypothetical protein